MSSGQYIKDSIQGDCMAIERADGDIYCDISTTAPQLYPVVCIITKDVASLVLQMIWIIFQ